MTKGFRYALAQVRLASGSGTRQSTSVGIILGKRRRRLTNIIPTLDEGLVLAGSEMCHLHVFCGTMDLVEQDEV